MEMPVYIFSGFLDSGKTKFATETLTDPRFTEDCRTLLLLCEEGMEEYPMDQLAANNVVVEVIEDEEEINVFKLNELERKYRPDQIVVEYNGMWELAKFEANMPANWVIYQLICMADASTFGMYVKNMGAIMMEKLMAADMIVFNRCTDELAQSLRKRNLKMVNRRAEIFMTFVDGHDEEYDDGTISPFDLKLEHLDIGNDEFAFFYVDVLEHPERYAGKTVTFTGRVAKDNRFPKGSFVAGRHAMVCCEEDISFLGLICMGPEYLDKVHTRDWIKVTARIHVEQIELYEGNGPMLYLQSVEPCDCPDPELVQF